MKLLLLFTFFISSVWATAQTPGNGDPNVMKQFDLLQRLRDRTIRNDSLIKGFQDYLSSQKQGNIIYLLQDQMPCLIPNTKDIVAIPNVWSKVTIPYKSDHHPIPNPSTPIIPFNQKDRFFFPGPGAK